MQSTHDAHCTIDACTNSPVRGGLCYGHYMRGWRYGDPEHQQTPPHADLRGRRFGSLVALAYEPRSRAEGGSRWVCQCDCGEKTSARSSSLTGGGKLTCGDKARHRRDDIGNRAAHERVQRDRGPATDHACVDCGGVAAHWSYDHKDPAERQDSVRGPYSLDPEHYMPRCVACHKAFDLRAANAA